MFKLDLQLFGFDKGFFEKVFEEESTPIVEEQPIVEDKPIEESTEVVPEVTEAPVTVDEEPQVQIQEEVTEEPLKVNIEGIGELEIDEIKQGYLRQSDYTQKTQQLAEEKKAMSEVQEFYDFFAMNPHLMERLDRVIKEESLEVNQPETIDPNEARIKELEQKIALQELKGKYADADVDKVVAKANELGVTDLEFVYKALKTETVTPESAPQIDIESLKQELMKELLPSLKAKAIEEAQQEISSTQSIVTGGTDSPPTVEQPVQLSQDEVKVARMMNMTPDEYYKYKNLGN